MAEERPTFLMKIHRYLMIILIPGFLAGALAGIGEAVFLSAVTGKVLMRTSLFFHPFLGAVAAVVFSIIMGIFSVFIRGIYGTRGLESIYFSAVFVLMTFSIISNVILKATGLTETMLSSYLLSLVLVTIFFFIGLGLLGLFKKFAALIKIRWQFIGIISYVVIASLMSISAYYTSRSRITFEPYDLLDNAKVAGKPYIVFIIVDALRSDWLSLAGYDIDTPNFEDIAADGIYYPNAIANCSWTKPSVASIITSMYPFQHNALTVNDILNPDLVTIAEIMRDMGYYTVGFHNNPHIGSGNNFHQGFNYYTDLFPFKQFKERPDSDFRLFRLHRQILSFFLSKSSPEQITGLYYKDAIGTSRHAINWIAGNRDKKFFLFLHYMDPHSPYFIHPYNGVKYDPQRAQHFNPREPTPEDIETLKEVYRQEVVYIDSAIGMLTDYLKEIGIYDSTLITIISDHGEEFYEHQGWIHARTLYDEVIRIPMLIKLPDSKMAGTVDTSLVQALNLAPTVLSCLGHDIPQSWEGFNLLAGSGDTWAISHTNKQYNSRSLRNLNEKLYLAYPENLPKDAIVKKLQNIPPVGYYRLDLDPMEQNNLADNPEYSGRIAEMTDSLTAMQERLKANSVEAMSIELDPATAAQLKALGYIE